MASGARSLMAVIKLVEDVIPGRMCFMPSGKYFRTPETLKKQSEAHLGHEVTAEARANQSLAQRGRKHSSESIARRVATRKARGGYGHSSVTREKIAEARRGKELSAEHRATLAKAHRGLRDSEETKQRKSKAQIQSWASGSRTLPTWKKSGGVHNGVWMRCLNSEGVFADQLDKAGIKWLYEPRRFKTSQGTYLPDFFLPEFNIWVEIKGRHPSVQVLAKLQAFREETGKCLIVVYPREELERRLYS